MRANFRTAKEGALQILKICEDLTDINLEGWKSQIIGKLPEEVAGEGRVAFID